MIVVCENQEIIVVTPIPCCNRCWIAVGARVTVGVADSRAPGVGVGVNVSFVPLFYRQIITLGYSAILARTDSILVITAPSLLFKDKSEACIPN